MYVCALIEHLSQQHYVGMPFSLQMRKPRLRRLTSVSKDSHGVMPEPGLKCKTLTASPTFQKQALCCPLSAGNVNNDFQDRAGRGQPLSDLFREALES